MPDKAAGILKEYLIKEDYLAPQKVNSTNLYVGQNLPVKTQISLHRTTLVMGGKHIKVKCTIVFTEKRTDGGSSFGVTGDD